VGEIKAGETLEVGNEPIKRKPGRPRKNPVPPQVEAVPVPAENAPESADADRGDGEEGWADAKDVRFFAIDPASLEPIGEWQGSPAQIAALDHDHNGEAGGSLPKARLTDLQLKAYAQDASDAYEGHGPVVREDGFYRIWRFQQETVKDHANMALSVRCGPVEAKRHILMSQYRYTDIEVVLRELDEETSR
jgi:hypothetical protein